jgi:hypothetical protein
MTGEWADLDHHRTIPGSKSLYLLIPTRSLFILFEMINDERKVRDPRRGKRVGGRGEERWRDPRGMTTVEELAERFFVGYGG